MSKLKKPLFISQKNDKDELKNSDDGKFGLVGADTKFDLITRVFGGGASYALSASSLTVDEGSSVTFTFTTNQPDQTYYWTNSGTSTAEDFTDAANSGSFVIASGTGSITRTLASDLTTEGAETIIMNVRNSSYAGTIVASSSVTINDTSIWTPDLLTQKYGYYKADTGVTTSGNSITAWADQSGLGNTLTSTANPLYVANGAPNGKPAVSFSNTFIWNQNLQGINLTSSDMTIIYIGKMDTWQSDRGIARFDINASSFSRSLALRTGPNSNWGGDANSNQGLGINGTRSYVNGLATTPAVRIVKRINNEGVYVYENGTLVSQASASLAAYSNVTKRFMIGTNITAGTRAATTAYEVILLGYAISDEDIAKIQTYAQNYWGI